MLVAVEHEIPVGALDSATCLVFDQRDQSRGFYQATRDKAAHGA